MPADLYKTMDMFSFNPVLLFQYHSTLLLTKGPFHGMANGLIALIALISFAARSLLFGKHNIWKNLHNFNGFAFETPKTDLFSFPRN